MDWFSWLSKTKLDPSLIYHYGLVFSRNELQLEDASCFDHEFLQSMGISIAKHRLEILKLAKKENIGGRPKNLSGVLKKCLKKCVSILVFREEAAAAKDMHVPEKPNSYQEIQRGALVTKQQGIGIEEPVHKTRTVALSGPLDGRMHEKVANTNKVLKLSGPLDRRIHERMAHTNRNPIMPSTLDGRDPEKSPRVVFGSKSAKPIRPESPRAFSQYKKAKVDDHDYDDDNLLWPTLFQDLKPT